MRVLFTVVLRIEVVQSHAPVALSHGTLVNAPEGHTSDELRAARAFGTFTAASKLSLICKFQRAAVRVSDPLTVLGVVYGIVPP
jgi:hypothetical protein